MAGALAVRRSGGVVIAVLLTVALPPPEAAAAEPEAQVLPGATVSAVTVDLDADGSAELVRLRHRAAPGLDLEAWALGPGGWSVVASGELAAPDQEPEEGETMSIGGLHTWTVDGERRPLVATASYTPSLETPPTVCCLTLAEVRLVGDHLELLPLETDGSSAELLMFADLDADGTDELITSQFTYDDLNDPGTFVLGIERWNGSAFQSAYHASRAAEEGYTLPVIGESDGRPGAEVFFGPTELGELHRLVMRDGEVLRESANLDLGERYSGWVIGTAGDAIVVQDSEGVRVVRWPGGGEATETARLSSLTFPSSAIVGDGSDALLITHDGFDFAGETAPTTTVHDLDLTQLGEVPTPPTAAALWELFRSSMSGYISSEHNLMPYFGPLPGGLDGAPAYLTGGMVVRPGGPDGFEAREAASLLGVLPIGTIGPDGSWVALAEQTFGYPIDGFFLAPFSDPPESGRLRLAPTSELLLPDERAVNAAVETRGAYEVGRESGTATLLAPPEGFEAVVTAPEGSVLIFLDGVEVTEHDIGAEPLVIEVGPRGTGRPSRNQEFDRTLVVMTPGGRGSVVHWQGTFVREPPELSSSAESHALSLQATVIGRTAGGSTVTVDGQAVSLNKFGAFRAEVDAPPWPRDVVVVARDPLGNETATRLEVIGLFDYRDLPWVPILGVGTLGAGVFLFVRTPVRRGQQPVLLGDATLEEIDGS